MATVLDSVSLDGVCLIMVEFREPRLDAIVLGAEQERKLANMRTSLIDLLDGMASRSGFNGKAEVVTGTDPETRLAYTKEFVRALPEHDGGLSMVLVLTSGNNTVKSKVSIRRAHPDREIYDVSLLGANGTVDMQDRQSLERFFQHRQFNWQHG